MIKEYVPPLLVSQLSLRSILVLALEGIKVLDLTRIGPGPFCTMVLGDLGAEVIKVESPPAVGKRKGGIFHSPVAEDGRREAAYQCIDRNKKSIGLNLSSKKGRSIFYRLAGTADVIVEAFRPGVVKRLGIDYETIVEVNPRVIYCSISGYGQDGPYKDLSGHDINYIAMGGLLGLIGGASGQPVVPLNIIANHGGAGMNAVTGILSAIIARTRTGKGQYVDIAIADSVISLLAEHTVKYLRDNIVPKRGCTTESGGYPYYNVYKTRDDKYITIGCIEPWLWENLCKEMGREDYIDYHFSPEHFLYSPEDDKWQEVSACLEQYFLTRTRDEWFDILRRKDIPVAKVHSLDEVFSDPQVLHRQMLIEVEDATVGKVRQMGVAIKLSDTPGSVRRLSPTLGEHTGEVLSSLGCDQQQIDSLRQEGVIN